MQHNPAKSCNTGQDEKKEEIRLSQFMTKTIPKRDNMRYTDTVVSPESGPSERRQAATAVSTAAG